MIPVSELVEDLDIYPRTDVASSNVGNIRLAMEAGRDMPALVADRKTKRIIDGWHRRRAYIKVFGEDHVVEVELRDYKTDTEMLLDAVECNTGHGLPLQEIEKHRLILRLNDQGVADQTIAYVLRVPERKVNQIKVRIATVVNQKGEPIRVEPLKKSVIHFKGGEMTAAQAKAHRSAPGVSYLQEIQQLRDAAKHELFDRNNDKTMAALQALVVELTEFLAKP